MDTGITSLSQSTYDFHLMTMWVCVVIGLAVYCALVYSLINHRKSNRTGATEIHVSTRREVFWTLISFIILITLANPAMQDLLNKADATRSEHIVLAQPTESIPSGNQYRINTSALYILDE